MVSALIPRVKDPGSRPGKRHCVVFLGKTLHSQCLSPPRSIKRALANSWGNLTNCGGVTCDGLASCSGGIEILLATS